MEVICVTAIGLRGQVNPATGRSENVYHMPGELVDIAEEDCPRLLKLGAVKLPPVDGVLNQATVQGS